MNRTFPVAVAVIAVFVVAPFAARAAPPATASEFDAACKSRRAGLADSIVGGVDSSAQAAAKKWAKGVKAADWSLICTASVKDECAQAATTEATACPDDALDRGAEFAAFALCAEHAPRKLKQACAEHLNQLQEDRDQRRAQADAARRQAINDQAKPLADAAVKAPQQGSAAASIGEVSVMGSLDKELVAKILSRSKAAFGSCLAGAPSQKPVTVKWTISATGTVTTASVSNSALGDPVKEECLAQLVKKLVFPKPKGGGIVVVTAPISAE